MDNKPNYFKCNAPKLILGPFGTDGSYTNLVFGTSGSGKLGSASKPIVLLESDTNWTNPEERS